MLDNLVQPGSHLLDSVLVLGKGFEAILQRGRKAENAAAACVSAALSVRQVIRRSHRRGKIITLALGG